MHAFPTRIALLAFAVLPALGFSAPSHPGVVATYTFSCDAGSPRPRLRTLYTGEGRAHPRPASAPVEVFERGTPPPRPYIKIGDVSVLASDSRQSIEDLTLWAQRGARQLGGDAIVDASWNDAASVKPPAGAVGLRYLTADVVRWQ